MRGGGGLGFETLVDVELEDPPFGVLLFFVGGSEGPREVARRLPCERAEEAAGASELVFATELLAALFLPAEPSRGVFFKDHAGI